MKRGDSASMSAAAATGVAHRTLVRRRIQNTVRVLGDMHSGDDASKRRSDKDGDNNDESSNDGACKNIGKPST